jgi:hypothetical protein
MMKIYRKRTSERIGSISHINSRPITQMQGRLSLMKNSLLGRSSSTKTIKKS